MDSEALRAVPPLWRCANPMKKSFVISFVIALSTVAAFGCFSTPPEQIAPADKLVERTSRIVLARVVEAKADFNTGEVTYSFIVEKAIKGTREDSFSIVGYALFEPEDLTTFDYHRSAKFWEDNAGRCHHDTDCKIHPSFAVGASYLIFVDHPYHRKSFEYIAMLGTEPGTRDKWLAWVEETVRAQQVGTGQPATRPESKPEGSDKPQSDSEGRSR
jgi:hypothetical protein